MQGPFRDVARKAQEWRQRQSFNALRNHAEYRMLMALITDFSLKNLKSGGKCSLDEHILQVQEPIKVTGTDHSEPTTVTYQGPCDLHLHLEGGSGKISQRGKHA